jgi:hypothetical protein
METGTPRLRRRTLNLSQPGTGYRATGAACPRYRSLVFPRGTSLSNTIRIDIENGKLGIS